MLDKKIVSIARTVDTGKAVFVYVALSKNVNGLLYSVIMKIELDSIQMNAVPYSGITEAIALGWVTSNLTQGALVTIEANLDALATANPSGGQAEMIFGIPW
jgi:hypothetical protein